MFLKQTFLILIISALSIVSLNAQRTINLSGRWAVTLDKNSESFNQHPEQYKTEGEINLPGSLEQGGFGYKTEGSDYGILTPEYKFIGKASYTRKITIPKEWKKMSVELILERVLWESTVFVDGKELSRQDALGTEHIHNLGVLSPGEHTLTVVVDNDMVWNIGDKGHAYGEYTQSIWNGIVGKIELNAYDPVRVLTTSTTPDISKKELTIDYTISSPVKKKGKLTYNITPLNSTNSAVSGE
jgi:hypothetical protein